MKDKDRKVMISKLDDLIEQEKIHVKEICEEIGKQYVKLHPTNYDVEYAELMKEHAESMHKLDTYFLQRQAIKGVIICPNPDCKSVVAKGSVYCNMCATKLPEICFEDYKLCKQCSSIIKEDEKSCPVCGYCEDVPTEVGKKCPNPDCGRVVDGKNTYCPYCGHKLDRKDSSPTSGKKCPNPRCGRVVNSKYTYCIYCATKLD